MNVDEFLAWAMDKPGKRELFRGQAFQVFPAGAGHAECKGKICAALRGAIRDRKLPCQALPSGLTVRVDYTTAYVPDALVYCGERLPPTAIEVPNPVAVIEILAPWTVRFDTSIKLPDYFRLPSLAHYLIVDSIEPLIIHHSRGNGGTILTRVITEGAITLDPPGLELAVADLYAD